MSNKCLKKIVPVNILEKQVSFSFGSAVVYFSVVPADTHLHSVYEFFQLIFNTVNRIIVRIFLQ